jgi:hypothetical protein
MVRFKILEPLSTDDRKRQVWVAASGCPLSSMISMAMEKWMWFIVLSRMPRLELYWATVMAHSRSPLYYHAGTKDCAWEFGAGDFTSNGKTDFIVWYCTLSPFTSHFASLLGNGDGTFQKETKVSLPDLVEDLGLVVGDWNSDGLLDFVMLPEAYGVQVYSQK